MIILRSFFEHSFAGDGEAMLQIISSADLYMNLKYMRYLSNEFNLASLDWLRPINISIIK